MWPFKQQADEAQAVLDAMLELQSHITDQIAECDVVEALTRLRHMVKVLRAHEAVAP